MPHVAFCITELESGGAERALARIATGLHERGRRVSVVALAGGGELVDELRRHGIETDCLGLTKWNLPVVFARLVGRWRRDRPDVVQSFLFHGNIIGRIAARAAGVGVVCSGIRVAERRGRMRLLLDRLTDRLVDRHVCVSRAVAEDARVRGGLPASKLVTIPNGVDLERYESASPIFPRDLGFAPPRFLLWAGRLDPQKDPQLAIEIFAAVASGVG
ncbi:MAG: glycosyltransferase, partial [Planctomycetota bacterium]